MNVLVRRFVIYVGIGAGAFAVDYSIFLAAFYLTDNPYAANAFGIAGGIATSFTINRSYNFRKRDLVGLRAMRFIGIALTGLVVSTLIILLLVTRGIDARIAKVIAMAMVFVVQFLANALWTFR